MNECGCGAFEGFWESGPNHFFFVRLCALCASVVYISTVHYLCALGRSDD
jgi:hypothetical protein